MEVKPYAAIQREVNALKEAALRQSDLRWDAATAALNRRIAWIVLQALARTHIVGARDCDNDTPCRECREAARVLLNEGPANV